MGIKCARDYNIRFRHEANPSIANTTGSRPANTAHEFPLTQPWVSTDRSLTFLDETQELISIYEHAAEPDTFLAGPRSTRALSADHAVSDDVVTPHTFQTEHNGTSTINAESSTSEISTSMRPPHHRTVSTGDTNQERSPPLRSRLRTLSSSAYALPGTDNLTHSHRLSTSSWTTSPDTGWALSPLDYATSASRGDPAFDRLSSILSNGHGATPSSNLMAKTNLGASAWPLRDIEEGRLLRYFCEHLARDFDLTDPQNHFRTVVPQRAASCPILEKAIFALSSRHMSRTGSHDPLAWDRYHQECLNYLIPLLDDTSVILDENLLASTVLLRHLEEIELPLSGHDCPGSQSQNHLLGAHAFIAANEQASVLGGLREAAFWIGLRQEVYAAFVNARTILPALTHCNIDRSCEAAADHIWAKRMVVLCADALRYCFDDNSQQTVASYTLVSNAIAQWIESIPATFRPLYSAPPGPNQVFPELWYLSDEVMVGLQHYHLSRILLVAHDPRIPRLGLRRAAALKLMDEEIKDHVRTICGICVSNPSMAPNFICANMAITMAGDKFTERQEQDAVLEVLNACDAQHAWPSGTTQKNLRESWGWDCTE